MIALLKKFFTSHSNPSLARERYAALVAEARQPSLYQQCGLPDTLDGRYEAIVLHLFVAEQKLSETSESMQLLRDMHEAFFDDMDRGLREGGVGDTGIGKRVKRMASGLYGRLQAYRQSIHDHQAFKETLLRNAYATRSAAPSDAEVEALIAYIHAQITPAG